MTALEKQIGGNHYKNFKIQPIEFIHKNDLGFEVGNIIKYICRYKLKGEIQDLEKAKHYIELLIELSTNKSEEIENPLIICLKCSSSKENCKCKNLKPMAKNFSINLIKKDGFYICYDCNNSHSPFDIKNCECNCHEE